VAVADHDSRATDAKNRAPKKQTQTTEWDIWLAASEMIKPHGDDTIVPHPSVPMFSRSYDEEGFAAWKGSLAAITGLKSTNPSGWLTGLRALTCTLVLPLRNSAVQRVATPPGTFQRAER
jgi:hypothetical protein